MDSGTFITLEGGEGAGKSTQIRLLAEHLRAHGLPVLSTREPGGSPGAEQIRRLLVEGEGDRWDPVAETLLFYAARRDHLERTIRPALAAGSWVLCDRFDDSTRAYQGAARGLDPKALDPLYALVAGDLRPRVTLILDLPPADGLARAGRRGGGEDRFERMDLSLHDRLRAGFLAIAAAEPHRCAVIDALGAAEAVAARIRAALAARIPGFPA